MAVARVIVVLMPSFYGVGAAVVRQRRMVKVRPPFYVLFLFVCFDGEEKLEMSRVDGFISLFRLLFWLVSISEEWMSRKGGRDEEDGR